MKPLACLVLLLFAASALTKELPGDSVYQVDSIWTTAENRELRLPELAGTIQVVSFVYTYCEHTCPTIIARLKAIENSMPDDTRRDVRFTLVSLDPGRDTPEVLRAYRDEKGLDPQRWTLLNGTPHDVRELAALFGVRYRPMGSSDIAHSNMISVLDGEGVIRYQMQGLSETADTVAHAIQDLLAPGPAP